MDSQRREARREHARRRESARRRRRRTLAGLSLLLAAGAVAAVALASVGGGGGGGGGRAFPPASRGARAGGVTRAGTAGSARTASHSTVTGAATGRPGSTRVPILMYHVINPPPPGAPFPGLYVSASEFSAQMQALAEAGYHAITQDQMWAYWKRGVPLPAGKPIVLSFDNGYQSQYSNALPVLRRLGWVGDENIQLTGLPPSEGGLSDSQVRGLVAAGWELDTQGVSHADLIALSVTQLAVQVAGARKTIQRRYGVPVNWFCYPSGHYDATVIAAVKSAGYTGSTTVVPGWAGPDSDPYRLPRLRVLGDTSPEALLSELQAIRSDPAPPASYSG